MAGMDYGTLKGGHAVGMWWVCGGGGAVMAICGHRDRRAMARLVASPCEICEPHSHALSWALVTAMALWRYYRALVLMEVGRCVYASAQPGASQAMAFKVGARPDGNGRD